MGRFPRNENSRVEATEPRETSNVQHRTPNAEASEDSRCHSMFEVECSSGFMGSPLSFFARIGTMNQIGTPLPPLSPQGGERVAEGWERGGSWGEWTLVVSESGQGVRSDAQFSTGGDCEIKQVQPGMETN